MCSIAEEDFVASTDQIVELTEKLDLMCKKCSTEKAMVRLQKRHSYCRNCFVTMVSHKCRSTLGKTKLMKNDEKVLCVFHGDQASIALSSLLKRGTDEKTHKRIRFRTVFLFIDESPLRVPGVFYDKFTELFAVLQTAGFECFITKLSSIYEQFTYKAFDCENVSNSLLPNDNDEKLSSLFRDVKSNTSKIEMLSRLRYQLYFNAAESLDCQKIFAPECGTDLSIKLLSNVALGRGSEIPSDVAVCDKRHPNVLLIRPLREITSKELAFFNVFNKLESSFVNPVYFMCDTGSSLQEETESFIYRLQEEFPSTVYTIFHTGDKLKIKKKSVDERRCYFCFHSFKTSQPTEKENLFTSLDELDVKMKNCSTCDCRKNETCSKLNTVAREFLCSSCQRIIVSDLESADNFPPMILNAMKSQSHLDDMKKQIEHYLL